MFLKYALPLATASILLVTIGLFTWNLSLVQAPSPLEDTSLSIQNQFTYSVPITIKDLSFIAQSNLCDEETCSGPGAILLQLPSGGSQLLQSEELTFYIAEATSTTDVSEIPYARPLAIADYNFDGTDDLCVSTGNRSGYGSPSCDVYLFDKSSQQFVFHSELTNLSNESLGYLAVDSDKKLLSIFKKSGCCQHTDASYTIQDNALVLMYETSSSTEQGVTTVSEKRRDETGQLSTKTWVVAE